MGPFFRTLLVLCDIRRKWPFLGQVLLQSAVTSGPDTGGKDKSHLQKLEAMPLAFGRRRIKVRLLSLVGIKYVMNLGRVEGVA